MIFWTHAEKKSHLDNDSGKQIFVLKSVEINKTIFIHNFMYELLLICVLFQNSKCKNGLLKMMMQQNFSVYKMRLSLWVFMSLWNKLGIDMSPVGWFITLKIKNNRQLSLFEYILRYFYDKSTAICKIFLNTKIIKILWI